VHLLDWRYVVSSVSERALSRYRGKKDDLTFSSFRFPSEGVFPPTKRLPKNAKLF
jgi:hypothetical protein